MSVNRFTKISRSPKTYSLRPKRNSGTVRNFYEGLDSDTSNNQKSSEAYDEVFEQDSEKSSYEVESNHVLLNTINRRNMSLSSVSETRSRNGQEMTSKSHTELYILLSKNEFQCAEQIVMRWWTTYKETSQTTLVAILNLILELSGYGGDVLNVPGEPLTDITVWLEGCLDQYHRDYLFESNNLLSKKTNCSNQSVSLSISNFFASLATTCPNDILTKYFLRDVCGWLLASTKLHFRHIRQVATHVCLVFYEALVARFLKLKKESEMNQSSQKDQSVVDRSTPARTDFSALKRVHLESSGLSLGSPLKTLYGYLQQIFDILIGNRWRDCCPYIRRITFTCLLGLNSWYHDLGNKFKLFRKAPNLVLSNEYTIQLISFALSDRYNSVREVAAEFLAQYLTDADSDQQLWESGFFQIALPRLVQLPRDKSYHVCVSSMIIMKALVGKSLLQDNEVEQVVDALWTLPSLLVMEMKQFSLIKRRWILTLFEHFSEFINMSVFSINVLENKDETSDFSIHFHDMERSNDSHDVLILRCILEFILEFVDDYESCIDLVVTTFWNQTPCLHRIGLLVQFFYAAQDQSTSLSQLEPLSCKYRLPLALLIHSIIRHLQLAMRLGQTPFRLEIKRRSVQPVNETVESLELFAATETLLNEMICLLRNTKSHAAEFSCIIQLLCEATLYAEPMVSRLKLHACLDYLVELFLNMSDLRGPYNLLGCLFASVESLLMKHEGTSDFTNRLFTRLMACLKKAHVTQEVVTDIQGHQIYIQCILLKCLAVICTATYNPYEVCWDIVQDLEYWIEQFNPVSSSHENDLFNCLVAMECLIFAYDFCCAGLQELFHSDDFAYHNEIESRLSLGMEQDTLPNSPSRLLSSTNTSMSNKKNFMFCNTHKHPCFQEADISDLVKNALNKLHTLQRILRSNFDRFMFRSLDSCMDLFLSYVCSKGWLSLGEARYKCVSQLDLTQFEHVDRLRVKNSEKKILCTAIVPNDIHNLTLKCLFLAEEVNCFITIWTKKLHDLDIFLSQKALEDFDITSVLDSSYLNSVFWMFSNSTRAADQEFLLFFYRTLIPYYRRDEKHHTSTLDFDNPAYAACHIWMVSVLVRQICVSPLLPKILLSDLGIALFSLLWHGTDILNAAFQGFIKSLTKVTPVGVNKDHPINIPYLMFRWFSYSIIALFKSKATRYRIKLILMKLSNWIDPEFLFSHADKLFNCFKEILIQCDTSKIIEKGQQKEKTNLSYCLIQLLPKTKDKNKLKGFLEHFQKQFISLKPCSTFAGLFEKRYSSYLRIRHRTASVHESPIKTG